MTFPVPTYADGTIIDNPKWSAQVAAINDLNNRVGPTGVALNVRADALEALTTNTGTNGGQGNARLADRLGTGVGTGTNTTTGSAASQLASLRTRMTSGETTDTDHAGRIAAMETSRTNGWKGGWVASGTRQRFTGGANLIFNSNPETGVGVSYSGGLFTFTKFGKWALKATVAFGEPTSGDSAPAAGTALALRFKRQSDGATFGQNIGQLVSSGFGGGTAIGWDPDIQSGAAVWSVEMVPSATPVTVAADSRVAFTATYLGS
ncbi:hypothetical protein CFN78_06680 [Amycolatopsis antarctica]|uniref:Uncharacterized protein n=1 Tax=Amycolatopsis antarctica TaxID=1854586 RepID=A0A263D8U2_9PSEU|nr:hypothetical protein [Amycolatopsis antarctica]OZM73967.1 hypothetical protein CFN78_06680 [Amycolatopsis antarctica]